MGFLSRARKALAGDEQRFGLDQYAQMVAESFMFDGVSYSLGNPVEQTLNGNKVDKPSIDFNGLARSAYHTAGVTFACMMVRQLAFSTVRFQYQRLAAGRPSEIFGDQTLRLLERPWQNGTTQDLLTRVINDADLAGNFYGTVQSSMATIGSREPDREIVRLRPDWTAVAWGERSDGLGFRKVGYVYEHGGFDSGGGQVELTATEVAHFAPLPDPLAPYRGMSWLSPIVREMQADRLMEVHKRRFFENGATPNMVIKHPVGASPEKVRAFRDKLNSEHAGAGNAYKTLHLGVGADVTVVGSSFEQIDFAVTQGHGETRIAAAAGVPPVIVGLSEGLAAATYSNYGQARRRFADGTMHPLWQNVAASFAPLLDESPWLRQSGVRLWYDARDVPFLREDEKDSAEIREMEARTMRTLVDGGYTPDSVKRAVISGDYALLEHSGLFSVQLQAAGAAQTPTPPEEGSE